MSSRFPNGLQTRTPESPETKLESEFSTDPDNESEEDDPERPQIADIPFAINYVYPENRARKKTPKLTNEGGQDAWPKLQKCLDIDSLDVQYKILPMSNWDSMKSYQTFISKRYITQPSSALRDVRLT